MLVVLLLPNGGRGPQVYLPTLLLSLARLLVLIVVD